MTLTSMLALMTSYRFRSSSVSGATRSIKPGIKILPSVVTSRDTEMTRRDQPSLSADSEA